LNETLAQGFIEKIASDLEFNVNIMNEKGIIIASKDASRIGDFHEIAYGLVRGKLESGIVNEERKYIGTKPGVNLTIRYSGENVGVICVTGDPDRVNSFAHLVQTSLEALLEYEIHREQKRILKNNVDQFLFYLLFEKDVDFKTASEMAQKNRNSAESYTGCTYYKIS
jgi:carbohydrate diacid regulator